MMNRSYKTIGVITLLLMVTVGAMAQSPSQPEKKYEYRIRAGFNIGGTTPIPLPAEIRGIESYSPTMLFSVEGSVMRWITPKWALTTGLRFETKGMNAGARVKNYQMTMMIENGDMTGDMTGRFTGRIRTRIQNEYITLPRVGRSNSVPTFRIGSMAALPDRPSMAISGMVTPPALKWELKMLRTISVMDYAGSVGVDRLEQNGELTDTSPYMPTSPAQPTRSSKKIFTASISTCITSI